MSAKAKTVMMVAGFGLLAYVLLNTYKSKPGILMSAPTANANRNPYFTLNFPGGMPSAVGNVGSSSGGIDLSQFGWLISGAAQMLNPNTQSIDPAIFDVAGGMSTNNGYYVPTGIGADVAGW